MSRSLFPYVVAAGLGVGLAVVAAVAVRSPGPSTGSRGAGVPGPYVEGPAGIRALARPLSELMGMPESPDFLAAKAYTESRYKPGAGDCADNAACGLYGMRGNTAQIPASLLSDPRWSTMAAHDLIWRLGHKTYHFPGQVVTWGALARGWALPELVADVDWSEPRSQDVLERFEEALDHVGLPHSFIDHPAYPPGARHPGKPSLERALGLQRIA